MISMSTLTKEARGPFVYSMLDGDALTAVEHLEFLEFATEGGENVIFIILEARYRDKDPIDRAGKALFDVFEVSAREGERLGEWSARAHSVFHACQGDAGIAFPVLIDAGCRTISAQWCWDVREASTNLLQMHLRRDHVFLSIGCQSSVEDLTGCSCQKCRMKRKRRRNVTRETMVMIWMMLNEDDESDMVLEEDEVREVLASAWKQKRQDISKEKLRRGFGRPSKSASILATRRFCAEVEELKPRTKLQSLRQCWTLGTRMSTETCAGL